MAKDMEELLTAEIEAAKAKKKPPLTQPELNLLNAQTNVAQAVNPIAALLGLSGNQDISKTSTTSSVPAAMDPAEFKKAEELVRNLPLLQQERAMRQSSLEGLDPSAMLGAPQRDLSSLMALADAWSKGKSNMLGAYQKPTSVADRTKLIAGIQKMIKDETEGMSDTEREFLKLALSGKKVTTTEDVQKTGVGKGGKSGSVDFKRYQDGFLKDPLIAKARESVTGSNFMLQKLDLKNPASDEAAVRELVRMYNSGAMSDRDVASFASIGSMQDKIRKMISKGFTGVLDDTTRNYFRQFARSLGEGKAKQLEESAKHYATEIGTSVYGYDPNQAYTWLQPHVWKDTLDRAEKENAKREDFTKRMQALEDQIKNAE